MQTKHFSLIHSDLCMRKAPLCPASFGEPVDKKSSGKLLEFQARTLPNRRTFAILKKIVDAHSDTSCFETNNCDQQRQQFLVGYACYHWGYPSWWWFPYWGRPMKSISTPVKDMTVASRLNYHQALWWKQKCRLLPYAFHANPAIVSRTPQPSS